MNKVGLSFEAMCLEGSEPLRGLYAYKKIEQSSKKLLEKFR